MTSGSSESFVAPLAAATEVLRALDTEQGRIFPAILADFTLDVIRIHLLFLLR